MSRKRIQTNWKYERLASYSRAVVESGWVFVSGCTGMDYDTGEIAEDARAQTEKAIENIEAALTEAGASLPDIVRMTCYIADRDCLAPMVEVLGRAFRDILPTNTTVIAQLAVPEMKIEIEVQARLPDAASA